MIDAIKEFFKSLFDPVWDAFQRLFDFFNELWLALRYFLQSLSTDFVFTAFLWVQGLLESLPVPDFVTTAGSVVQSIPPEVVYFVSACQVGPGLNMILGAYVLRFIIRRIPIFG
ncbi:DUF2523 family protein [Stutzerimonas sp. NM35]